MPDRNIFISAGEVSGDLHAAELMKALSALEPYNFYGLGGPHMKARGLKGLEDDVSTLNTIGFVESLRFITRQLRFLKQALAIIANKSIKTLILVDNQGFNMILGKKAREQGLKVFYYIPPRVSVWAKWNAPKVVAIAHHILPFLASDVDIYREQGAQVFYPGNPVTDKIKKFKKNPRFVQGLGIKTDKKIVSIFPGSRFQEIKTLLNVFMKAAAILIREYDIHILISLAHEEFRPRIEQAVAKMGLEQSVSIVKNAPYDIMSVSEVNIMASGTATLESALLKTWPLICYRISWLSYYIYKRLLTRPMIGLPNILLDEKYFPELLQRELNVPGLVQQVLTHINAPEGLKKQKKKVYQKLSRICGEAGVAERAARYIQEHADGSHSGD